MSLKPSGDSVLSILSTVICTASVAALVLTITIHIVTWKHSKSHQHVLLLNLCVALAVAYLVFLVGSEKKFDKQEDTSASNEGNGTRADVHVGCKVVAVLLHYFFLAAFFMMLAEGIQLFIYVFFVFHARRKLETAMLAVTAWVLPLIIVAICLWVTKTEGYGEGLACWLSYENSNQLIWAFIAPAFTILAINGVIIVVVFVKISCSRISSSKNDRKTKIRKMMWNISVLCPVLGITWLFGVLTVSFDNIALQYIFAIVNSAQGIFIFIFHSLFVNEKFNAGLSSFCDQCVGDSGSKKVDKRRKSTKEKKSTRENPSDVNHNTVDSHRKQEMANDGFSYSSEKLPSFSDSSERSPISASDDTFLATSPTSNTIDTFSY